MVKKDSKEYYEFKKQLKFLKAQKGQGTELITVYIKPGQNVNEITNQLRDEYGQAANIKSKQTRKNVQMAIDRILGMLRGINKPPEHGVGIFAGNINNKIELFTVLPPEDLGVSVYRCDSTFFMEPLEDLIDVKEMYGLFVMDRREATIAMLKGKKIKILRHLTSTVPGKHHKGGQCIHADSLVQLGNGLIKEIKEVEEKDEVASFNRNNYLVSNEKCNKVFSRTWDEYYKIKTKSPCLEIKTTPEHWFFVADNYGIGVKYAEDLKKGDQVLIASKTNIKGKEIKTEASIPISEEISKKGISFLIDKRKQLNLTQKQVAEKIGIHKGTVSKFELMTGKISIKNIKKITSFYGINWKNFSKKYISKKKKFDFPKKITPELCQFVGYFIGDGNKEKTRIRFYDEDKQGINHYANLAKKLFNVNVSIKKREAKNYYKATFYGEELIEIMGKNFKSMFNESKKAEIPENIMKSKNEQVAGFIKGLFDAEGYVRENRIGISMASEKIIKQLQVILLRFGVISSVRKKYSKPNHRVKSGSEQYELDITDNVSIIKFKEKIGFASEKKMKKLKKIKTSNTTKTNQIPAKGMHILKLAKKIGLTTNDFNTSTNFFRNERNMSKAVFEKVILKKAKTQIKQNKTITELEKILNSEVIQATITSKEKINEKAKFYDLSIPKTESFIANNFVLHNSAMRFTRLIAEAVHDFFKEVGNACNKEFADKKVVGIIAGGPGPTKFSFINGDYLFNNVKEKIIATIDISYTDEFGITELMQKSQEVISQLDVTKEKELVKEFLKEAVTNGLATYGEQQVIEALKKSQVKKLLLSETLDEKKIEQLTKLAEETGAEIEMISEDTPEGQQFKIGFLGIGAFLRYK